MPVGLTTKDDLTLLVFWRVFVFKKDKILAFFFLDSQEEITGGACQSFLGEGALRPAPAKSPGYRPAKSSVIRMCRASARLFYSRSTRLTTTLHELPAFDFTVFLIDRHYLF